MEFDDGERKCADDRSCLRTDNACLYRYSSTGNPSFALAAILDIRTIDARQFSRPPKKWGHADLTFRDARA